MNTAANIIKIPCEVEGFYLARNVLRDPAATAEQISAACDVLAASTDFFDQRMVRNARNVQRTMARFADGPDFTKAATVTSRDVRTLLFLVPIVTLVGLAIGYAAQRMWGAL